MSNELLKLNINCNMNQQAINWKLSASIIQASRVNQALCDEAENGRIHGCGAYVNGLWTNENIAITLHQSNCFAYSNSCYLYPNYQSMPQINALCNGGYSPINLGAFPYLRMACGGNLQPPTDMFGLSYFEYQQTESLGKQFGLTGIWGDKNRIETYSNWHEDLSILTTSGDNRNRYIVNDYDRIPQYAFEIIEGCILPFKYLKRPEWPAPRRVYFPPEQNIAIFFPYMAPKSAKTIVLTNCIDLATNIVFNDGIALGCFPGGTTSIQSSDFSCLDGKEVNIFIQNMSNLEDIEFAVKLVAFLRRKYVSCDIFCNGNFAQSSIRELSMKELISKANSLGVDVPEELQPSFLGDISATIIAYLPKPIIWDLINSNSIVGVSVSSDVELNLVESHIISKIQRSVKENLITFIPNERKTVIANNQRNLQGCYFNYDFLDKMNEDEVIKQFKLITKGKKVVIFAGTDLVKKSCDVVVRYCVTHDIAVIYIGGETLPKYFTSLMNDHVNVSPISGYDMAFSSTNDRWNYKVSSDECQEIELDESDKDQLIASKGVPSKKLNFDNLPSPNFPVFKDAL